MANEDKLDVQLNLITAGANKALEGLKGSFNKTFEQAGKDLTKATSGINSISKSLISVKSAAISAGTAIITYFGSKQILQRAIEDENAINAVAQALGRTGQFSKEALRDVEEFSRALQQNTIYSAGEVQQQFALALAFGATTEQAETVTKAAIELAAVTGKTLDEATAQVTKTLSGQAGALGKLSPRIKQLTADQLKAGRAAEILLEQFGGTAIGQINTFGGAIQQNKNAFNDLLTQIGMLITKNPVVVEGIKAVTQAIGELANLLEGKRGGIIAALNEGFATLLETAPYVASFFKFLISVQTTVIKFMSSLRAVAADVISTFLQFGPVKFILDGLILVIGKLVGVLASALKYLSEIPFVAKGMEKLGINAKSVSESLDKVAESAFSINESINVDNISKGLDKFSEFNRNVGLGAETVKETLNKAIDAGVEKAQNLAKAIRNVSGGGQIDIKVVNDTKEVSKTFDNLEQLLTLSFGGERGGKIAGTILTGLANGLKNGKEGARALISSASGAIADAFLPGLGQVVGPLVDVLSQGPEAVRQMVKDFAKAIPDLIQNIIEAVPVLIEELAVQLPIVFERLVDKIPEITEALIKAMPKVALALSLAMPKVGLALAAQMPKAAVSFIAGIIKGAPKFIEELVKGIGKALQGVLPGGSGIPGLPGGKGGGIGGGILGSVIGGAVLGPVGSVLGSGVGGSIKKFLGFAKGGEIPSGFPNDTFPARLSSKELVIDRSTNELLKKQLKNGGMGGVSDVLLTKILNALENPVQVSTAVRLNQREFANIILELNRTQQRTT